MAGQFVQRLEGLLSGSNQLGNLGLGMLAASGPSTMPTSLGQVLASGAQFASTRQMESMKNDAIREDIAARRRRREALSKLTGLLGSSMTQPDPTGGPPSGAVVNQPPNPAELMGLLGEISPDALAQGMLGKMLSSGEDRAEPADVRTLRAAGVDPTSEEGREILLNSLRGKGASDEVLKSVQLQLQAYQLDDLRRQRLTAEDTAAKQRRGLEVATRNTFEEALELAQLNDQLESTFLETGQPLADIYRGFAAGGAPFLEGLGFDTKDVRTTVAKFDRFKKLSTRFGLDLMDRLAESGTITDTKYQGIKDSIAGIGISPGANRLVIGDVLQTALDSADVEKIEVGDRAEIQRRMKELRERGVDEAEAAVLDVPATTRSATEAVGRTVTRAADIARMNLQQLQQLDPSKMSKEVLEAAARRFEQLGGTSYEE